jgi:hypothetical protein
VEYRLVEEPSHVELVASGSGIREIRLLRRSFGGRNWRKLKGIARIELPSGTVRRAEVHWYECHGVGRKMMKVKKLLS